MLKKTDVYEFIKKVQFKAIKAVNEKYDTELAAAIETTLNAPENRKLRDALKAIELNLTNGIAARDIIKKIVPDFDKWNAYFTTRDIKKDIFSNRWGFPEGFETVKIVHAEYDEKIRRVNEEYAKIMRIVQNKKTGEQGKTALIALGFDVTYLDNLSNLPVVVNPSEVTIDKSIIFPCGESGV